MPEPQAKPAGSAGSAGRTQQTKMIVLVSVLLLCVFWIGYQLLGMIEFKRTAQPPDTPMHRVAAELNAKLFEEPRFRDVEFSVNQKDNTRFVLYGAVHTRRDLDALRARLAEIRPENDYDEQVEIMNPGQ